MLEAGEHEPWVPVLKSKGRPPKGVTTDADGVRRRADGSIYVPASRDNRNAKRDIGRMASQMEAVQAQRMAVSRIMLPPPPMPLPQQQRSKSTPPRRPTGKEAASFTPPHPAPTDYRRVQELCSSDEDEGTADEGTAGPPHHTTPHHTSPHNTTPHLRFLVGGTTPHHTTPSPTPHPTPSHTITPSPR